MLEYARPLRETHTVSRSQGHIIFRPRGHDWNIGMVRIPCLAWRFNGSLQPVLGHGVFEGDGHHQIDCDEAFCRPEVFQT